MILLGYQEALPVVLRLQYVWAKLVHFVQSDLHTRQIISASTCPPLSEIPLRLGSKVFYQDARALDGKG